MTKITLVVMALLSLLLVGEKVSSQAVQDHQYIARWEWSISGEVDHWRCPGGDCSGAIDLRSLVQASVAGGVPQGYGWFSYPHPKDICPSGCATEGLHLGNTLDDDLKAPDKQILQARLGIVLDPSIISVRDALQALLTQHGDPSGLTRWKPMLSDQILLAGRAVVEMDHPWFHPDANAVWKALASEIRQEDYERLKAHDLSMGSDQYLRVADKWIENYGFDPRTPEQQKDGTLPHQTQINESFNTADSDTLGPNLTWTEVSGDLDVVSNEVSGSGQARAETDLSTDDHYAQITQIAAASSSQFTGPAVRYDSSDQTYYVFVHRSASEGLYKRITGTYTLLSGTTDDNANVVVKTEIDGSTLKGYKDDVEFVSVTDPSITGNLRTGLDFSTATGDDFEACDLPCAAAASPSRPRNVIQVFIGALARVFV